MFGISNSRFPATSLIRDTIRAAFLMAALTSWAFAGTASADPLVTARSLIRAGHYMAAIEIVQRALASNPTDARLWMVEGIAYSLNHDDTQALRSFHRALAIAPDFPQALEAEASILSRQGSPAVIPVLHKILRRRPDDGTAHEMLALAEAQQGDCRAALNDFAQSGPAFATHVVSVQRRAACLLETKAYPEAVSVLEQLHASQPDDSSTTYDLAIAQFRAGNAKSAATTLLPLLQHEPDVDTLLLAADVFEEAGDTPRAASLLRQAIVDDPTHSDSYVRFAELCMTHESYQAGIDMLTAGISRLPHEPSLYLARGLLYGGMAKYDQAEADFHSAEVYDPNHGTGAYAVGLTEAQRNNPVQALDTTSAALKAHPEDAQLHVLLARLLLQNGAPLHSPEFSEATRSAEEAVRLAPNLVAGHELLAQIYSQSGRPALAAQQSRAALALDPSDESALYRLMRSLRATGDIDAAEAIGKQLALEHQQARVAESSRLRYRIETGSASEER